MPSAALRAGTNEPDLGEHDDERILAEESRLARHVRSGDDEDARRLAILTELAVIADEACAVAAAQILLDHRVAPLLDGEDETSVDLGADIALLDGQLGETSIVIELGKGRARCGERLLLGEHVSRRAARNIRARAQARAQPPV